MRSTRFIRCPTVWSSHWAKGTGNDPNGNLDIALTDDTSGFLAATKLADAKAVFGIEDERTILADLSFMTGVSSGSLNINGVSISIDIETDSLEDVLARIDAVVPDVDVEFDAETKLVSLVANDMKNLSISSGDTGFFAAINMKEGLYNSVEATRVGSQATGFSYSVRRDTARAINEFGRRFNSIFENRYGEQADSFISELRSELMSAISDIFDPNLRKHQANLGIEFDMEAETGKVFQFGAAEKTQFVKSLKTNNGATEFNELFFGETSADQGIVDRMLAIVKSAESKLSLKLGSMGSFVDVWA